MGDSKVINFEHDFDKILTQLRNLQTSIFNLMHCPNFQKEISKELTWDVGYLDHKHLEPHRLKEFIGLKEALDLSNQMFEKLAFLDLECYNDWKDRDPSTYEDIRAFTHGENRPSISGTKEFDPDFAAQPEV